MKNGLHITTILPALNEEGAIAAVLREIPAWVDDVVVVDNGSRDRTAEIAAACGARVVSEPRPGYGAACLAGIAALGQTDIVVFLDADHSDYPQDMGGLVDPIIRRRADFVLGSRRRFGDRALTLQQRLGNSFACLLLRLLWRARFTDLGPFRAIHREALDSLAMRDRGYGWTIEMQIKAVRRGLRILEVPVRYRERIGQSKISGTVKGTIGAGCKICWTILRYSLKGAGPAAASVRS